jgi:intracellular multiplication protein IcmE
MSDNQAPEIELPEEEQLTSKEKVAKEMKKKPVRGAFIVLGIALVLCFLYVFNVVGGDDKPLPVSNIEGAAVASVSTVPGQPGTSEEYVRLAEEANSQRAQQALQTGGSAIPSITTPEVEANPAPQNVEYTAGPEPMNLPPPPPSMQEQPYAPPPQQANTEAATAIAALMANWGGQTQRIYNRPKDQAQQVAANAMNGSAAPANVAAQNASVAEETVFHTGDLILAVTDNEINTDIPNSTLRAIVVDGPHKGGVLTGTLRAGKETVELTFKTLKSPRYADTLTINGIAMDANTAQMAISGNVDRHYLLRYGTLFAASFISGFAEAASRQNTSVVNGPLGGATTIYGEMDTRGEVLAGLGKVGDRVSNNLNDVINTPNTITVPRGTMIGIQMQSDVKVKD